MPSLGNVYALAEILVSDRDLELGDYENQILGKTLEVLESKAELIREELEGGVAESYSYGLAASVNVLMKQFAERTGKPEQVILDEIVGAAQDKKGALIRKGRERALDAKLGPQAGLSELAHVLGLARYDNLRRERYENIKDGTFKAYVGVGIQKVSDLSRLASLLEEEEGPEGCRKAKIIRSKIGSTSDEDTRNVFALWRNFGCACHEIGSYARKPGE